MTRRTVEQSVSGETTNKNNDMSKKENKGKNKSSAAKSAPAVSLVGRSDYIRKLKSDGLKWDDAFEKVKAKYPGSSIAKCRKVWDDAGKSKPAKAAKKSTPKRSTKPKTDKVPARSTTLVELAAPETAAANGDN